MPQHNATDLDGADNLQRPPHSPDLHTTTKPLIVTPTLVSRGDDTPWRERPHDKGASVDRSGREVKDADRHQETGLEGEGCEFWTVANYSVINRLVPELPTEF